jgi:hypothetical protein
LRNLTKKEQAAVDRIQKAVKNWPSTLWLFGCESGISIMLVGEDGQQAVTESGCVDPDYVICMLDAPGDGGAW